MKTCYQLAHIFHLSNLPTGHGKNTWYIYLLNNKLMEEDIDAQMDLNWSVCSELGMVHRVI